MIYIKNYMPQVQNLEFSVVFLKCLKNNESLCCLISGTGIFCHKTTHYLSNIIKLLCTEEYTLKDIDNVIKLQGLRLQYAYTLSSTVDSLFTNAPLLKTIDFILEHIG